MPNLLIPSEPRLIGFGDDDYVTAAQRVRELLAAARLAILPRAPVPQLVLEALAIPMEPDSLKCIAEDLETIASLLRYSKDGERADTPIALERLRDRVLQLQHTLVLQPDRKKTNRSLRR